MIKTSEGTVSVNGTETEIILDLIAIFIALIDEGYGHVATVAIGYVLETGGKALND